MKGIDITMENLNNNKNSIANKFIGNTSWIMIQQIYSMILSLVVGSLSARYLGPSNYGVLNYGTTIISLFTMISTLGLTNIIISEMVMKPQKAGSYLGSALVVRLIVSVVSLFFIYGIVIVLEPGNKLLLSVTMLQALAIIFQGYEVFTYWFQFKLQMRVVSLATMLALTVVAIWRILLLINKASVEFFALSNSLNFCVAGAVVAWFFFRKSKVKLAFSFGDARYLIGRGYHLILSSIAVTLYCQIDKLMIGKLQNEEQLGFYAAATTIALLWEFIPNALINSARPLILEKRKNDYTEYQRELQLLMLGINLMGVIVSLFFTFFGKIAILILYGKSYLPSQWPLAILIWSTSAAMIGNVRNIWIVAEGYEKYTKYFSLYGAIFNAILNYFFILRWGIIGASITTLISQVAVNIFAPILFKETRPFVKLFLGSFMQISHLKELCTLTIKRLIKK